VAVLIHEYHQRNLQFGWTGRSLSLYPPPLAFFYSFRYDVRLLLDVLPPRSSSSAPPVPPESPTGWSDLPSDSEDMFFSPDEADDFRREKKRKLMERTKEERLKARMLEDGADEDAAHHGKEEDVWGGSDEEVCLLPLSLIFPDLSNDI